MKKNNVQTKSHMLAHDGIVTVTFLFAKKNFFNWITTWLVHQHINQSFLPKLSILSLNSHGDPSIQGLADPKRASNDMNRWVT